MTRILLTFVDAEAAHRWDLHRLGKVSPGQDDLHVVVEPKNDWVTVELLQRGMAFAGYQKLVTIEEAPSETAQTQASVPGRRRARS